MRKGSLLLAVMITATITFLTGRPPALGQNVSPPPAAPGEPPRQLSSQIPSGPGGIAFVRDEWIFYIPPGSEKPFRLRQGKFPALSPDGRRVVFRSQGEQADSNGPKGQKAAAPGGGASDSGLAVLDISTGKVNLLLKDGPSEVIGNPAWSPSGDRLAFTARAGLKEQLDLIQADGSGRQSIFTQGNAEQIGFILGLVWAPDGKSLWFHDNHHLYQVSDRRILLAKIPLKTIMGKPAAKAGVIVSGGDCFVPDPTNPQLLAFTKQVEAPQAHGRAFPDELPGISALFLYDSRSKTRTRLTPKDMWASHPCWSRDGRYLYFSGYRQPHYQEEEPFRIYRISRDGKDLKEITRGRAPSL